jgi:hypothetical protein
MVDAEGEGQDAGDEEVQEQPRVPVHSKVLTDGTVIEAAHLDGKPRLLVRQARQDELKFFPEFPTDDVIYIPPVNFGYPTYDFQPTDNINERPDINTMITDLLREYTDFIDTKNVNRLIDVAFTLLTYQKHKVFTVPYRGYFGDNETGKGQRCTLHRELDYRAFYGTLVNPADLYYILEETRGTLIEDEVEYIDKNPDKLALWKSGYKKGLSVSRLVTGRSGRLELRYFDPFGPKVMASNTVPWNKGLLERLIVEMTDYGRPGKDEFTDEDRARFSAIRKHLLLWSLHTYYDKLPEVELPFEGRLKEVYKPLLQMVGGTSIYGTLKKVIEGKVDDKVEERQKSLEGMLTKVCLLKLRETDDLVSEDVRDGLANLAFGEVVKDEAGTPKGVNTDMGFVSNKKIAALMRTLFGGVPARIEASESNDLKVNYLRGWKVDPQKLVKEARKYKLDQREEFKARVEDLTLHRRIDDWDVELPPPITASADSSGVAGESTAPKTDPV